MPDCTLTAQGSACNALHWQFPPSDRTFTKTGAFNVGWEKGGEHSLALTREASPGWIKVVMRTECLVTLCTTVKINSSRPYENSGKWVRWC